MQGQGVSGGSTYIRGGGLYWVSCLRSVFVGEFYPWEGSLEGRYGAGI